MNKNTLKILGLAFSAWTIALSAIPGPAGAQGMMGGVDLSSPAFTKAEFSRADIEALIARRARAHSSTCPTRA